MPVDPKSFNTPAGVQLKPEQIDNVALALMSLAREVCVLTDRVHVLEHVLDSQGIEASSAVDHFEPDDALEASIAEKTQRIIDDVISSLSGREYRRS